MRDCCGARRRNRSLLEALADAVMPTTAQCLRARAAGPDLATGPCARRHCVVDHHTSGEVLYDYCGAAELLGRLARADQAVISSGSACCPLLRACPQSRGGYWPRTESRFWCPISSSTDRTTTSTKTIQIATRCACSRSTAPRVSSLPVVFVSCLVDGRFPVRSRPPALALPDRPR